MVTKGERLRLFFVCITKPAGFGGSLLRFAAGSSITTHLKTNAMHRLFSALAAYYLHYSLFYLS
jgi:hypothetical protein